MQDLRSPFFGSFALHMKRRQTRFFGHRQSAFITLPLSSISAQLWRRWHTIKWKWSPLLYKIDFLWKLQWFLIKKSTIRKYRLPQSMYKMSHSSRWIYKLFISADLKIQLIQLFEKPTTILHFLSYKEIFYNNCI